MKANRNLSKGFTLVELLVVIAIIGILIALLLPAVQAAREAARRMQCTNHMKQVMLAMHNHHDARKCFPPGNYKYANVIINVDYNGQVPAFFSILPYLEQTAVYDGLDHWYHDAGLAGDFAGNAISPWTPLYNVYHEGREGSPAYRCPSDGNSNSMNDSMGYGGQCKGRNIVLCRGDVIRNNMGTPGTSDYGTYATRTIFAEMALGQESSWKGMGAISDGTSNTMAISETIMSPVAGSLDIKGGIAEVPAMDAGGAGAKIMECYENGRHPDNRRLISSANSANSNRGMIWIDGRPHSATFVAAIPPNGPSCQAYGGVAPWSWGAWTAQSNHTGGVNVGLFDGSVQFISDTVDFRSNTIDSQTPPAVFSGESTYGVWGALGTINGGESKSFL